ncbi:hypothetical protein EMIT0158MI4_20625 [Burkholderia ambifaria]
MRVSCRTTQLRAIDSNEDRRGLMLLPGAYMAPTHKEEDSNTIEIETLNPLNYMNLQNSKRLYASGSGIRAD